jgi:hypothetical protein
VPSLSCTRKRGYRHIPIGFYEDWICLAGSVGSLTEKVLKINVMEIQATSDLKSWKAEEEEEEEEEEEGNTQYICLNKQLT